MPSLVALKDFVDFVLHFRKSAVVILFVSDTPIMLKYFFISCENFGDVIQFDSSQASHAGDHGSIPGLERSPREGIGYPLQFSWASLVAQMVKNLSAVWETWVRSLGWEDPLEECVASHSSMLAWRIPMDRGAWRATVHEVAQSWT